jgi:hypothetical protein
VGPRGGLDSVVKRKISGLYRDSNTPSIETVAQRYTAELFWLREMKEGNKPRKQDSPVG